MLRKNLFGLIAVVGLMSAVYLSRDNKTDIQSRYPKVNSKVVRIDDYIADKQSYDLLRNYLERLAKNAMNCHLRNRKIYFLAEDVIREINLTSTRNARAIIKKSDANGDKVVTREEFADSNYGFLVENLEKVVKENSSVSLTNR
ncbi:MAG: hypothetical protein AABX11_02105 [Nanoarchaeota archaeon]